MRERVPNDWAADLAGRHHLEQQMAVALAAHPDLVLLRRATDSMTELDYTVGGPMERLGHVELKAKRQPYRGWSCLRPELAEADLFILDELSLRKIVDAGRYTYLVVADLPSNRWCVWSTLDLVLATKTRTVRTLVARTRQEKAKVLLDLGEAAAQVADPSEVAEVVASMMDVCDAQWNALGPWPHGPLLRRPEV